MELSPLPRPFQSTSMIRRSRLLSLRLQRVSLKIHYERHVGSSYLTYFLVVFKIMVNPSGEPNAEFILGVNGQGMSANVKHEENNTLAVVIV